jgi:hypothetical protein
MTTIVCGGAPRRSGPLGRGSYHAVLMSPDLLARLRPARATIDLSRLAANYRAVAAIASVPLMPVIKADAYGHGAAHVARTLLSNF